jgi:cyclic beta-1,2-glucan synthetase
LHLGAGFNLSSKTILAEFFHSTKYLGNSALLRDTARSEPPLRAELFSAEQMEQRGRTLASLHKLSSSHGPDLLLTRLAENESVLTEACNLLTATVQANRRITPAGEWLLDNFYLIEEQIRTARRHLPKGYSRELPRLANGEPIGIPRVYDIALETISHGDGRVDLESLSRFVASYQTVTTLKLGELWAIPIMLRLALIENLRRVAAGTTNHTIVRELADSWADRMVEISENEPTNLILVIADMARSNPPMVSSFVAELARRLQGQGPGLAMPLTWIEQRLAESGLTIEQMVQQETQQQAANQVSISNSMGSLRFLGSLDWREFVESNSLVEQILREDKDGVFSRMEFATRDSYRHVVEQVAKDTSLSEVDVARQAIELAQASALRKGSADRSAHVGYYLIDKGLPELERVVAAKHGALEALKLISFRFPLFLYLGTIGLITLIASAAFFAAVHADETSEWLMSLIVIACLLSTSQLSVALVNWLATLLATPQPLPRMDFSTGIPPQCRTLVVVPTLLDSAANIEALVEALEVRFLANRGENLHFGLLTDFKDAQQERTDEDEPLLRLAHKSIEDLNEKYSTEKHDIFFLFHRPRLWNAQERVWMGYERKRGKLADLNFLLRGGNANRFSLVVGEVGCLAGTKYVITLDTDTQLPREAARQLVGAMAHPLNHPSYDEASKRVIDGYGILQPRLAMSLSGTNRSLYARLNGSEPGIDPYTRTVSDVYQDLFKEGSFIGKGIYDIDAFERSTKDRFPDNRILSHDLLEGCYARAGLLSDVQFYEDYPSSYLADVSRRHRWIRGDWQLCQWLMPSVPGAGGERQANPLSPLSRWKIFDNLRRSLVPAALTLFLVLGWIVFSPAWLSTLAVIVIITLPLLIGSLVEMAQKPPNILWLQHFSSVIRSALQSLVQATYTIIFLAYEAFFSLDAILRTIWRMVISHKKLLEWNPSSYFNRGPRATFYQFFLSMLSAPVFSLAVSIYLHHFCPAALLAAAPILALWFVSPVIAWLASQPAVAHKTKLTLEQGIFLRKQARKVWAFFETFVGADDNWLPPDNFQEYPVATIAHRTSPTNIGLALLANLSAYDFGYIQAKQLISRTASTFETMARLERHRGHFYNWYDTQSLKPLLPTYISTVDSGNLAAHLLTLRTGLLTLPDQKIFGARLFEGLLDALVNLVDAAREFKSSQLGEFKKDLESVCTSPPSTLLALQACLRQLTVSLNLAASGLPDTAGDEAHWWTKALVQQCSDSLDELEYLNPWLVNPDFLSKIGDIPALNELLTLRELSALASKLGSAKESLEPARSELSNEERMKLLALVSEASRRADERISTIDELAVQSSEFAHMEYGFLFDKTRRLLTIGYNVDERRLDSSYYDLLASEARLCNFVSIAQGQLPQESWFALGRLLTTADKEPVLLSWSGSMFEYLMPLLVMPTYEHTLLDQTYKSAVDRQIEYGKQRGVPWGISESCYNAVDVNLNYQYRAFGVPGLGLKRGLVEDLVIAPYASMLALMVAPEAACLNLQRLEAEGFTGRFGFYESIDYTPARLPRGQTHAVVRSFMAHHQGMGFLALAYLMLDRQMQKRFQLDASFQATLLLLQERIPKAVAFHAQTTEITSLATNTASAGAPARMFKSPDTATPEVQLLSNGRYHVMVTNAGGGYSRWKDIAVTRWREDTTSDNWGTFCYIRDVASGEFWSSAHQPTLKRSDNYEAIFSEARVEFRRRDHYLDTHAEIVVSSEDDIELRRVRITNRSRQRRTVDVTSYTEVVLAPSAADALHPAFSNLFVETEIIDQRHAILCNRRPRSLDEKAPWMFHLMAAHGAQIEEISYETDRMRFIGRGNTIANPEAMRNLAPLSGSHGSVLDPIVAIRYRITLDPEESATINIVTGIGETRDSCLSLVEKYQDRGLADRVFDVAWTHSQVVLRQINATEADAQLYGRLANSIIYANSSLRADASVLIKNRRGQSGLWGYAISGDLPIVLLQIRDVANIDLVRQLVQAHAYWRLKGLAVDLVIWNEDYAGYRQLLQEQILGLIAAGIEANVIDRPGGIFVRPAEQIANEDRILFQSVARAIILDSRGDLAEQIGGRSLKETRVPRFTATRSRTEITSIGEPPERDLILANGLGGFTPDGREYVITTRPGQLTPAPWANVLANPHFGTVISENGLAYTWYENAHEFRLTPWLCDPVSDASGEAFYIRDEETGQFWSPSPLPARGEAPYVSRHGFGYSVFEHTEGGISSELWVHVALDATIKFSVLKVRNHSGRTRRLSATGYVEWVLGDLRSNSTMHVISEIDPKTGALFARNPYNADFCDRIAFFDVDDLTRTLTGDRTEFFGRNGTLNNPAAMARSRLSGSVGTAMDPCAAIQVPFDLPDGHEREIIFRLGVGRDPQDASNLVHRFRGTNARYNAFETVCHYWKHTLGAVNVDTPDPSINMLTNGWLLYQTIGCRLWARSGYYQSGGAFGFRDQLQDSMALIHAAPWLLREQLLLCASRQFVEGDVQHWWHPPSGKGVRTHCSDDYLWLALATCRYVLTTGDTGILDESVQFLTGRPVNAEEDSYYDLPGRADESATLYEHCTRAILRGLRFGEHGLPLMGTGDWNDGMNLVGEKGKGESIWLGFFLYEVLTRFAELATLRGDRSFTERCQSESAQLRENIEEHGWDGEWYRRAYFDDGTLLGSSVNTECQIDSIPQSWSVLSGAADKKRSELAMNALDKRLVRRNYSLIQLLDPPFDLSNLNPGYIKGYVPGVRENGGQYTHAAIWATMAFAALGDNKRAWELFRMINPVNHANSPAGIATYKVEPYVVAADVYALSPHTGRGGWTWYTGSAGWMYRLIVESLLGLRLDVDKLRFSPCLPPEWQSFKLHYRYRETVYHITVIQLEPGQGKSSVAVEGIECHDDTIHLVDDRRERSVEVRIQS